MTGATAAKCSAVRPGDRLIFERPGGVIYGGAVWQSPTTGDIIAGDTFLTLHGRWLPEPTGDVTLTLDTTHRRAGEAWRDAPERSPGSRPMTEASHFLAVNQVVEPDS